MNNNSRLDFDFSRHPRSIESAPHVTMFHPGYSLFGLDIRLRGNGSANNLG